MLKKKTQSLLPDLQLVLERLRSGAEGSGFRVWSSAAQTIETCGNISRERGSLEK